MPIDYKKLLPSNLRETRWGEYMEAIQAVLNDIKTNKINIIENQFNIDEMTSAQILTMRDTLGYSFSSFGDGYTNSTRYLQRQILTITQRIVNRNNLKCYQCNFYIYDLDGNVYPMTFDSQTSTFTPYTDWWTWDESQYYVIDKLDLGNDRILYYDSLSNPVYANNPLNWGLDAQTLDTDEWPHLDMKSTHDTLTRHILIPYSFRYVEDNTYWMSESTLISFYEDIVYSKRATEIPYFEPIITVNCSGTVGFSGPFDSSMITQNFYYSYDDVYSGIVESYYYGSSVDSSISGVAGISYIQFGDGSHTTIDDTITEVQSPLTTISGVVSGIVSITDFVDVTTRTGTNLNVRKKITQKNKFANFSEIALMDVTSGVVLYAKFPEVTYLTSFNKFYSGVQLNINLI